MAQVIAPELNRICPLGPETGTWSGYNDRRLDPIVRASPTMHHSVNTRYSRVMLGGQEVRSDRFSHNQLESRSRSSQGMFERAVGLTEIPEPLLPASWPDETLFELYEHHLARLGTDSGLMEGEVILTDFAPTILMNRPLKPGATYQKGPFRLTITKVDLASSNAQVTVI